MNRASNSGGKAARLTDSSARLVRPARPGVIRIVSEVWDARELLLQFTLRDITVRYSQAVMGFAWALLMPLLIVGAGLMFRVAIATISNAPVENAGVASLSVKALSWAFFSSAISAATTSIVSGSNLIGKVYFPRETIPISSVAGQCIDFLVGATVLAVALPLLQVRWSLTMLWAPLLVVLLVMFTSGCALILSCANLFFRDVKYIVQVVLNFGLFGTPVFFAPDMLGPTLGPWMMRMPLSPFIQGIDLAVVHAHNLLTPLRVATNRGDVVVWSPWMLLYATALSVGVLVAGLNIFRRAAGRFAEMA